MVAQYDLKRGVANESRYRAFLSGPHTLKYLGELQTVFLKRDQYTRYGARVWSCALPRKVEYLKYIYGRANMVRTNEIASAFRVDPSTVTKTMTGLTTAGYITHVPYHGVCLTGAGKQHAEFLVKRYRILSLILAYIGKVRPDLMGEDLV
jgi:hypothetical protein